MRHFRTHRNACVQELGPTSRCKNAKKMLVYCPDTNGIEQRWTTAFYNAPDSYISVAVDEQSQLCVDTEMNGHTT